MRSPSRRDAVDPIVDVDFYTQSLWLAQLPVASRATKCAPRHLDQLLDVYRGFGLMGLNRTNPS